MTGGSEEMTRHRRFVLLLGATLAVAAMAVFGKSLTAQHAGDGQTAQGGHDMAGMPGMKDGAADGAMAGEHMDMGAHMKMTAPRPPSAADQRRADAIVKELRGAIAKYRDYHVAVAEGFVQFLPNLKLRMYHFTNWTYALEARQRFDPSRPTSLLYKPTAGGFELVGAMYTAPQRFDEEQLDQRVPLSVAAWHQHVDICLPPRSAYATSDWHRFGFTGTIATAGECTAAGGIFHPVIYGWMVHVYPFEQDPAKMWAH